MICALVEVSSKRAVEDAGDTQDETRIEEGAKGLTQKVADDILLGEEYENMTTPDAKVRALPGSAVTVEIVPAPSKDVLEKLEQHTPTAARHGFLTKRLSMALHACFLNGLVGHNACQCVRQWRDTAL